MLRYIALVWDAQEPAATQSAARLTELVLDTSKNWRCIFAQPGLRIYCAGERSDSAQIHMLPECGGVIVGTLFKRPHENSEVALPEDVYFGASAAARVVATAGRELIESYWGNYVAFINDVGRRLTCVLRGPASSLPCFRTTHTRVQLFFSLIDDCCALQELRFSVDWEFLAVRMIASPLTSRTALREVSEVLPGGCIEFSAGKVVNHTYWDPCEIARRNPIENENEATALLYRMTKHCVHAWASRHRSIVHSLSGGLDSSIILACLKDAPSGPLIACATEYSPGPGSDEREYARLAAQHAGLVLFERPRNTDVHLEESVHALRSPNPENCIRRVETSRSEARVASEHGATALFFGTGGDQLFYQNTIELTVADFLHGHGIGLDLARILYDAAQVSGLSVWKLLGEGFRKGLLPYRYDPLAFMLPNRTLVSSRVIDTYRALPASSASWLRSTKEAPPGKLWQIHGLSHLRSFYDPMGLPGDADHVTPLLSQPLIEAALRIPTYILVAGGWDRSLARRAFAGEVPREIIKRRSKGTMEEHMYGILRANLPFARQLLLDGLLVNCGLLDSDRINEALSDRPSGVMKGMVEVFSHLHTEIWLRTWNSQPNAT